MDLDNDRSLSGTTGKPSFATTDPAVITAMLYHRIGSDRAQEGLSSDLDLLPLHADRLLAAMHALDWCNTNRLTQDHLLHQLKDAIARYFDSQPTIHSASVESYKLNIEIWRNGCVLVRAALLQKVPQYQRRSIIPDGIPFRWSHLHNIAKIHVDTVATETSRFVSHKTTERSFYSRARARAGIDHALPTEEDVLLYSPVGEILETSCSTIYFRRQHGILVPRGGNQGVTRRLALEKLDVRSAVIELNTLKEGEEIWLSNAVRGFFPGKIITPQSMIDQAVAGLNSALPD